MYADARGRGGTFQKRPRSPDRHCYHRSPYGSPPDTTSWTRQQAERAGSYDIDAALPTSRGGRRPDQPHWDAPHLRNHSTIPHVGALDYAVDQERPSVRTSAVVKHRGDIRDRHASQHDAHGQADMQNAALMVHGGVGKPASKRTRHEGPRPEPPALASVTLPLPCEGAGVFPAPEGLAPANGQVKIASGPYGTLALPKALPGMSSLPSHLLGQAPSFQGAKAAGPPLAGMQFEDGREHDLHKVAQRQKQIGYGKNTAGYQRYVTNIPRHLREPHHPATPDVNSKMPKREFDYLYKRWRRKLHQWDPPAQEGEVEATIAAALAIKSLGGVQPMQEGEQAQQPEWSAQGEMAVTVEPCHSPPQAGHNFQFNSNIYDDQFLDDVPSREQQAWIKSEKAVVKSEPWDDDLSDDELL